MTTQHWNTQIVYRNIHSKQENMFIIETDGFLQEDSLQARQHSFETQGFYKKIHSKQDNTALKHKDFTVRFIPSKTTQHWNTKILQEDSLRARQHSIETQGFLQEDSVQVRQHSIETQGFLQENSLQARKYSIETQGF